MKKPLPFFIGNTPLVKLKNQKNIYAKLEYFNPSGSIKDRAVYYLVKNTKNAKTIVEATSGNTGISLAYLAPLFGKKAVIVLPESTTLYKIKIIRKLGAKVVVTSKDKGFSYALERAHSFAKRNKAAVLGQFENDANWRAHYYTTAAEIWKQLGGKIDIVVAGIGTGGTITGLARFFKKKNPRIKIIGVEPQKSPAFYNFYYKKSLKTTKHSIEGLGAGFISGFLKKAYNYIDGVILINEKETFTAQKYLIEKEGVLAGISTGAVFSAVKKITAEKRVKAKRIVFIVPDNFMRYII